jgi:hypothetical protein
VHSGPAAEQNLSAQLAANWAFALIDLNKRYREFWLMECGNVTRVRKFRIFAQRYLALAV